MRKIVTNSEKGTQEVGAKLWQENKRFLGKKAIVFALEGELGTGKTQLVKGLAKAMGVKDQVISPTFTLETEYDLGKLIHIDAWRIKDPLELLEIGLEKRIEDKKIIVIEWADQVREILLNESRGRDCELVWVRLEYVDLKSRTGEKNENERMIEIINYLPGSTSGQYPIDKVTQSEQSRSESRTVPMSDFEKNENERIIRIDSGQARMTKKVYDYIGD